MFDLYIPVFKVSDNKNKIEKLKNFINIHLSGNNYFGCGHFIVVFDFCSVVNYLNVINYGNDSLSSCDDFYNDFDVIKKSIWEDLLVMII